MKRNYTIALLLILCTSLSAQYQIGLVPKTSPDRKVFQKVGYTTIDITYGSPSVKERDIWGQLVPYNKVWRAGANRATTVEFNNDVAIEGQKLAKGKYALFLIPKENNKWIAIFSSKNDQWGAFRYNSKDDALRVEILPRRSKELQEELIYSIRNYGYENATITLQWEFLQLELEVSTNYLKQFESEVESRVSQASPEIQWVVYLQGAEYLIETEQELELASKWINKSEERMNVSEEWNKQFYPKEYIEGHLYWTKAKLLAKQDNLKQALAYAEKLKAVGERALYYNKNNEAKNIDTYINEWKE